MQINSYMKNSSNSNAARGHTRTSSSLDKLNPKELDNLIAEVSLMHSRAELYLRFIKKKLSVSFEKKCVLGIYFIRIIILLFRMI